MESRNKATSMDIQAVSPMSTDTPFRFCLQGNNPTAVGTIIVDKGKVSFEGDADESAEYLVRRNSQQWAELEKRIAELETNSSIYESAAAKHLERAEVAERRVDELKPFRTAYMEWSDKTDWVQSDKRFDVLKPWGMHRADVLKAYIEHLETRIAELGARTVKLPLPSCTYADHSYPAYSKRQVNSLLESLGITVVEGDV